MKTFSSALIKMLLLLLVLPVAGYAQKTGNDTTVNEQTGETIIFYPANKNGHATKTGTIRVYYDTVLIGGFGFLKGKMNGECFMNSRRGVTLLRSQYTKGKETGMWYFYSAGGILIRQYNYNNNTTLYYNKELNGGSSFTPVKTPAPTDVLTMPVYPGGDDAVRNFIANGLNTGEPTADAPGEVSVTATINAEGKLTACVVDVGITKTLDAEAVRLVKALPNTWQPATCNGKPVAAYWHYKVNFTGR